MKVQSDAISRLDMRLQSVETDSRRLSILVTPKAPSPPSVPFETTERQKLPTEPEEGSQIVDYVIESMGEPDENENDFSSALVPKKSHPDSTALESALQGSREERLCKTGLQKEQTSISISSIPMVIPEFTDSDIITKSHLPRHLPDITYARGTTHIKKSIERQHTHQQAHQVVIVNTFTRFGTQTGTFLDLETQKFYAEIRSNEYPQYDFGPQEQPPTPFGYNGKRFINKMDPPMWEFDGNRMRRGASEQDGQNSSPQRQNSSPQCQNSPP